ncbi:MAG: SUF system NifU family Fe-S cluster assembly protein [Mariprofundaceae bacterium]|nr:SUF system NifU family Fe-S cluster assembly protein [Mariprofundaceae bacterium]
MIFDLRDLYQQVIVDHNKSPRNFHAMPEATFKAEGYNPLCGDKLTLYLKLDDKNVIRDVSFEGSGCAISTASVSLMTEQLKGKTVDEAESLFSRFHDMVTSDLAKPADTEGLGKLAVLGGVREFPSRIKCATLCWHTLNAALAGDESATTE